MDITELKPNSHKSRELSANDKSYEKRATKVITGSVKTKKNEKRNFLNMFISDDIHNVKSYVCMNVLVPAVKKAICDTVEMILFGEDRPRRGSGRNDRVSYGRYYDDPWSSRSPKQETRVRFNYDDITFDSRADARAVLEEMENIIRVYGFVRVADLYDAVEISAPYTTVNYGWFDLSHVDIGQLRDGRWILKLPKAMPIER